MRIHIKIGNGKLQRTLRLLATHHARRALKGLREMLPRVSVTLSDVTQATGGLTKRCIVEMKAGDLGTVTVASTAGNWQSALKLALRGASDRLRALWREATSIRNPRRMPLTRRPMIR